VDDFGRASRSLEAMRAAWNAYAAGDVPAVIEARTTRALGALAKAIRQRDAEAARQAAIDAAQGSLDLQLRYRPAVEIDLARFDLWLAQLQLDAAARDAALMSSSFFSLEYIRDRVQHVLDPTAGADINLLLEELLSAVGDADFAAAADLAGQLRGTIAGAS